MSEYTRTLQEQETAEAIVEDFREQLGPFVVAAEKTRMAMLFTDAKIADNPIIFANDAFLDLTGFTRDEVLGVCFKSLMARGIASEAVAQIENAFAGCADREPEICYQRKHGSNFWASVFISPVCDRSGTVEQHFISLIDLTGQREKQAHCEMLIDELNHRVKNTLVTVQSIVRQSLRATTDPAVIRTSIEARIFALSRSHDLLSRHNWEGADLRGLIEAELKPVTDKNGHAERVKVEGPRLLPVAQSDAGTRYRLSRACDQCGQIWRLVQRRRDDPNCMDGGQECGRRSTDPVMARDRWPPRHAPRAQRVWRTGDRTWAGA